MPIQQMLLGAGAGATKTYVDDVFSTYLYVGSGSNSQNINNGLDLSGEGGMVWIKNRGSTYGHQLFDTVRGVNERLRGDLNSAEDTVSNSVTAFNSNGLTVGTSGEVSDPNTNHASWTFRKTKGFFDVVKYTGGSSTQTISHNLGCIPGMILVKALDTSDNWAVYHRNMDASSPNNYGMKLNTDGARFFGAGWNVTATTFDAAFSLTNADGGDFIAYLFAGGESTAATARSVDFDGSGDYLSLAASSDLQLGTGDFTVEGWFKYDGLGNTPCIFDFRSTTGSVTDGFAAFVKSSTGKLGLYTAGGWICDDGVAQFENQWYHFAAVKSSGTIKLYINGEQSGSSYTTSTDFTNNTLKIGSGATGANQMQGWISNLRVVKGTALYTSSFRPPTEPLTNITNTKLLCCNNSSTTGSTVTPGTITANGDPTASTDSPFDDPTGFVFGENEDQNVIKCGSYVGSGGSSGTPEINLGFEPQWLLAKNASSGSTNWYIVDTMRGFGPHNTSEKILKANLNAAEDTGDPYAITSTGWSLYDSADDVNKDGDTYIYMAIRRPDGYVGKPPELGTSVFALDTGSGSNTIPTFDSGFPVDFATMRKPGSSEDWYTSARITDTQYLQLNNNSAENGYSGFNFDSNAGWAHHSSYNSDYQSWMWKRHAGFDVVTYKGDGVAGRQLPHGLSKTPEMMWVKRRDGTADWQVFHKGLNGGTDPEDYVIKLNTTSDDSDSKARWNDTAPTSTHFTLGDDGTVNGNNNTFIAMLFASTDVSKVGYYAGSNSEQTISCGFQPRFAIIRNISMTEDWGVYDTLRGWSSGNDKYLKLNDTSAQSTYDFGQPTSTGFTLVGNNTAINKAGNNFIFYAHA